MIFGSKSEEKYEHYVIRKITDKIFEEEKGNVYNIALKDDGNYRVIRENRGNRYFISPFEYDFPYEADLKHSQCSGGLKVKALIKLKIRPGGSGFADWLFTQNLQSLSKEDFFAELKKDHFNFKGWLQNVVEGLDDVTLFNKYNKDIAVRNQDMELKPWLHVTAITSLESEVLKTQMEKRREEYNNLKLELQKKFEEERLKAENEMASENIREQSKDDAAAREVADIERRKAIELAEADRIRELEQRKTQARLEELEIEKKQQDIERAAVVTEILKKNLKIKELECLKLEEEWKAVHEKRSPEIEVFSSEIKANSNEIAEDIKNLDRIELDKIMQLVRRQRSINAVNIVKDGISVNARAVNARDLSLGSICADVAEIREGQPMKLKISSSVSGYLNILCFGSDKEKCRKDGVIVLAPNCLDHDVRIDAGRIYSMPGDLLLDPVRHLPVPLEQEGPEGTEYIFVFVTADMLASSPSETSGAFSRMVLADVDKFIAEAAALPKESWAAGYLCYDVLPKKD